MSLINTKSSIMLQKFVVKLLSEKALDFVIDIVIKVLEMGEITEREAVAIEILQGIKELDILE